MMSRSIAAPFALVLLLLGAVACAPDPASELEGMALRRWVRLDGASNFRDLGGYGTEDGRRGQ